MQKMQQAEQKRQLKKKKIYGKGITVDGVYYSSMDEYVKEITQGKQGIYIGNQKIAEIIPFDLDNDNYQEFIDEKINPNEIQVSKFLNWCYSEQDYNESIGGVPPTLNEALEAADKLGVNKELIYWANNNKGDRIRNIQGTHLVFEKSDDHSFEVSLPVTFEILSNKYNFYLKFYFYFNFNVDSWQDIGNGEKRVEINSISLNPESISLRWEDIDGPFDDVELPYGMIMKYCENPYKPEDFETEYDEGNREIYDDESGERTYYSDKESYCEAKANLLNSDIRSKYIIEWQGQTFNVYTLRKYICENIKIYNNGKVWDIKESGTEQQSKEKALLDFFGFTYENLYRISQKW